MSQLEIEKVLSTIVSELLNLRHEELIIIKKICNQIIKIIDKIDCE